MSVCALVVDNVIVGFGFLCGFWALMFGSVNLKIGNANHKHDCLYYSLSGYTNH